MKVLWSQWRSRWAAFAHDFLSIPVAWLGAYWLRFNLGQIPPEILSQALLTLPWLMLFQTTAFWVFGLYRGVWRFASMPDLTRIVKAIIMGCLFTLSAAFLLTRLEHLPRSVIPLYGMLLLLILGGSRFVYRWYKDKPYFSHHAQRVLIVGAGLAGESLVRDLLRDMNRSRFVPVAFVDDKKQKQGQELHGIRVVGTAEDIPEVVKRFEVDMILIALPSANASQMRRIAAICGATQKPVRTLPSMNDLVQGFVSVKNLREISLDDLLGRDPVTLDWQAINVSLINKIVLVSGGGGSIGAELCRQVVRLEIQKLIIVDNSEYNLFCIEQELSKTFPEQKDKIEYHLLDVCDSVALERLVERHQPEVIFHAAAYKHVPLLEPQIRAGVRNNILGTFFLAQAAVRYHVANFVLVSTDKAVNPTNVMGATKRAAELVCQYFDEQQKTCFITVRFGNVLGSRGSVVETFQRQLEQGEPLSVTHPEVMRYFMTIPEASQLILQAFAIGEKGELFVLDMGEPVKIRYMAEQMIRLAGKAEEIGIEYIGLRPGEKLFEELFYTGEPLVSTSHNKILKANPRHIDGKEFRKHLQALQVAVEECRDEDIYRIIKTMVPELHYQKESEIKLEQHEVHDKESV
ncbi:MAG: polysaccharide biosynthesis protein [Candidatus Berkiellales bacterium]